MLETDIDYISENLASSEEKDAIISKLREKLPISSDEKQLLLKRFDYPTAPIMKEIRSHEAYGSRSPANAKAARDMRAVLDEHLGFVDRIRQYQVE